MGTSPTGKSSDTPSLVQEGASNEEFQWTIENEIHLFHAMLSNKPAGVNKHFHMAFVCEKFSKFINKDVSSDCIWKYLEQLYNFEVLDDIEGIPFPNDERDFTLPDTEYGILMKQKLKDISNKIDDSEDRSASPRIQTSRSASRGAASKENLIKVATSKKDHNDKLAKTTNSKDLTGNEKSTESSNASSKSEKDSKIDPRRDSKDSTSSNRESSKNSNSVTKTSKDTKSTKSSRTSTSEKLDDSAKSLDDSNSSKRGFKRSTRGSLKSEEPTPPSRRRRI